MRETERVGEKNTIAGSDNIGAIAALHIIERCPVPEDAISGRNPAKRVRKRLDLQEAFMDQALDNPLGIHLGDPGGFADRLVTHAGKSLVIPVLVLGPPKNVIDGLLGMRQHILGKNDPADTGRWICCQKWAKVVLVLKWVLGLEFCPISTCKRFGFDLFFK